MKPARSLSAVLASAALAATAVTALSAPVTAAPDATTCHSGPLLPSLGAGQTARLSGGDPSGRYLVGVSSAVDTPYTLTPVVWTNGHIRALDTAPLQPEVQVDLVDANRHGTVVGQRWTDYNTFHMDAFTYRAGRYTWLPPLTPGDETVAAGINDHGDVVGSSGGYAVVWPGGNPAAVRKLTVPGQPDAGLTAVGIDEDGTVLGAIGNQAGGTPYVWPAHGAPYELPAVPGTSSRWGTAIRNGWVAGYAQQGEQDVAVRWNLRTHQVDIVSTVYSGLLAVNRHGTAAALTAVIHRDGTAVPLDPSGYAVLLTDSGAVAGNESYLGEPRFWFGC